MATSPLSQCCGAEVHADAWGHVLCSKCWNAVRPTAAQRDIVGWLFPAERGKRPSGEPVFVRYGRKIELTQPGSVRGHPDSWSWTGA